MWDAIGDLPEAEDYDELLERDWVDARFRRPSEYAEALSQSMGSEWSD